MKAAPPSLLLAFGYIVLALLSPAALAADPSDALQIYDQTTDTVTRNFYDRTFRGLPWGKMVANYRRQLGATSSEAKLKKTINDLLATLHASHTEFLSDLDQEYWGIESIFSRQIDGAPFRQIGAWFVRIGGRWYVRNVFDHSPAESAGLLSGDEIVSAHGKPLEPVWSFADGSARQVRIVYRRSSKSRRRAIEVVPESKGVQSFLLAASLSSKRIILNRGKRIGYFRLWSGTHPKFQEALAEAAREYSQTTDAMILDLRDGFGGSGPVYLNPFFNHDEAGRPIPQTYSRPMVALINGGTRSGKEWIAYILQHTGRAVLLGSRTAGFFLGGKPFTIKAGKFLLFLAVDGNGPPGVDIEGKGVAPDIPVTFSLPYSAGRDPQLDAAIAWLGEKDPNS